MALDAERPLSLSVSMRFGAFALPSDVAERLPKALIHRNVPGEKIHAYLQAMDQAWLEAAPLASFGNRQRLQQCAVHCSTPAGRSRTARRAGGWAK